MRTGRLCDFAAINPPCPAFDRLADEDFVSFLPMEGVWPDALDMMERPKAEVVVGYTRFQENDVLVPKISPTFGHGRSSIAHGLRGGVGAGTTELHVLRAREGVDPRWLFYVTKAARFLQEGEATQYGVAGQKRIDFEWFRGYRAPALSLTEQRRIVEFLDSETARIDELIREQDELLRLLEERYRADLLALVTLGLDRSVEATPRADLSGVPVARGWTVRQLRSLPVQIQTGPFGSQLHQSDYVDDGFPVVNPANLVGGRIHAIDGMAVSAAKRSELARHVLRPGDIVFGRRGEMGRAGLVGEAESGWLCGTGSLRIRFSDPVFDSRYLKRFLETSLVKQHLEAASVGATMDNLNASIVGRVPLVVPPVGEQRATADAADRLERLITALSNEVSASLTLLREHRQALITAAVTDSLDAVREVA